MIPKRRWPWIAQQNWEDIVFIHKPVEYEALKPFVPYPFEIDTHNKQAWISIILFRATNSRLRFMPSVLSYPSFYQMNFRTYVRFGDERGVYFFNIHANNSLVTTVGKASGMPFNTSPMIIRQDEDRRLFKANQLFNQPESTLHVSYQPTTQHVNMDPDGLPHFLAERYAIWMIRDHRIIKAPIFHSHWKLREAHISILESSHMPFSITEDDIAHYVDFKHSFLHPFEKVGIVDPYNQLY